MHKEEPIVTYRTYFDPMLAHIELSRLQDADIQCFIADENMATINMLYNNAIGGIKIKVFESDIEKCDAILTTDEAIGLEQEDEAGPVDEVVVTCPHCTSTNVRFGDATKKRFDWFAVFISFVTFTYPFTARKVYHCFNCGKDFKVSAPQIKSVKSIL